MRPHPGECPLWVSCRGRLCRGDALAPSSPPPPGGVSRSVVGVVVVVVGCCVVCFLRRHQGRAQPRGVVKG